jgi:hypothetical protein
MEWVGKPIKGYEGFRLTTNNRIIGSDCRFGKLKNQDTKV